MYAIDTIVVGAGLTGATIARYIADEMNKKVLIIEKRDHIGGNLYDYVNEQGILVHQYGPHTFHTNKKELYDFICKYSEWDMYRLTCGAVIDGKYTPTPFNFTTIDDFFEHDKAEAIKRAIKAAYPNQDKATVLELLKHSDNLIREFAQFLYEKDYSLYTAKQWGISPEEIDPSVLKRVPVRFNYEIGYFDDIYQVMPHISYTSFFEKLLEHPNIRIETSSDFIKMAQVQDNCIVFRGNVFRGMIIYTGAIDELLGYRYGELPYRSLEFEWKNEDVKSFQEAPVVAYPQAEGYTRITEYTKLPVQDMGEKTTYAIEYSIPFYKGMKKEPYYPVLTKESQKLYNLYEHDAQLINNLYLCGRLADFKYYNMDQALERALELCKRL